MLFAVEGGGFFSSSALGYSKGLTLLLLGHKKEDQPMRVSPWSQYQLVEQDLGSDPQLQLASPRKSLTRGCASVFCFGCASSGIDAPHLKVGPTKTQEVLSDPIHDKDFDGTSKSEDKNILSKISPKSSLKRQLNRVPVNVNTELASEETDTLSGTSCGVSGREDERKVQWTDVCGLELVQIREFEPSETCGSDDEVDVGFGRSCSCVIM